MWQFVRSIYWSFKQCDTKTLSAIPVHNKEKRCIQNKTTYPKNVRNAMHKKHFLWKRHRQHPLDTNILLAYKEPKLNAVTWLQDMKWEKKEK